MGSRLPRPMLWETPAVWVFFAVKRKWAVAAA
jgi:hypothetical protein